MDQGPKLKERVWDGARRAFSRVGVDIVRTGYASPVPDPATVPVDLWAAPGELPGVAFDLEAQFRFLENELGSYLSEFSELVAAGSIEGFDLDNRMYGRGDADALYAMVRYAKPALVIEVGSGNSTRVAARALALNERDGAGGRLLANDPSPRLALDSLEGDRVEHIDAPLESVPLATFTDLADGDILFVDSSHISKLGSDVNRLILDIVPRLSPGVWVHFHDNLPALEYPRRLADAERKYWNEQYLLNALLAGGSRFEVKLGLYALSRADGERLAKSVRSVRPTDAPGAFWLRRVDSLSG